jgi:hypothetical protein
MDIQVKKGIEWTTNKVEERFNALAEFPGGLDLGHTGGSYWPCGG